jgi:hypothetical protein
MSNIDIVAAQRDEANNKLRETARRLEAAEAEIKRLKGGGGTVDVTKVMDRDPSSVPADPRAGGEVPVVTPQQSKRPRIFGGGA